MSYNADCTDIHYRGQLHLLMVEGLVKSDVIYKPPLLKTLIMSYLFLLVLCFYKLLQYDDLMQPGDEGRNMVRDWTLYVLRFSDSSYYVGITAYKDFMRRINQHGGEFGAKWNQAKVLEEVVEVQCLGRMKRYKAENIENDFTLAYRKKFGRSKVRGGYNIYSSSSLFPTYTPGSKQSIIFILACILLSIILAVLLLASTLHR